MLALKHHDLDITNRRAVRQLVLNARPALVVNCAVLGVDASESDPAQSWAVNAAGPEALAEATAKIGADFLHLSTNYVFDGERETNSFYTIEDDPAPINVYGRTKLAGERAVCAASPRSFIVRTSWVYGLGKKSFLSTAHQHLIEAKRLRAITDLWASTTYVADFVARVDEILRRRHYATYQVVNSGICSYYEFALEVARLLRMTDLEIEQLIEAVKESSMQRLARRPRYTPMCCLVSEELGLPPMRDWRTALADYLHDDGSLIIKG